MADSLQNIDKKCIWRESFESEQSVRRNGGLMFGSPIFSNGQITNTLANHGYYNIKRINGPVTVRVKFYATGTNSSKQIFDGRRTGNLTAPTIYFSATNTIDVTNSTTLYKDGLATAAFSWSPNVMYDICVTSSNPIYQISLLNSYAQNTGGLLSISLCEIYQGILTADEIKNLYENKRYREIGSHGEQLGDELVDQSAWYTAAYYGGFSAGWSQSETKLVANAAVNLTKIGFSMIPGKLYKFTITHTLTAGSINIQLGTYSAGYSWKALGASNTQSFYLYSNGTTFYFQTSASFTGEILAVSMKEVLVSSTELILDVCACNDGVVRNKLSGNSYKELIPNTTFDATPVYWGAGTNNDVLNGKANFYSPSGVSLVSGTPVLTVGKYYQVTFEVSNYVSGSVGVFVGNANTGYVTANGIYTKYGTCTVSGNVYVGATSGACYCSVDNVSVKEVIPSVISTAVSVVKENDVLAMLFNGSTSKIDCGSYDSLLGDKTIFGWAKLNKNDADASWQRIIDNGKFGIFNMLGNKISVRSDGTTAAVTGSNAYSLRNWFFLTVTRTSTGITNIYINGVLNGTANQSSGVPVVGTTNILFGGSNLAWWDGLISSVRVYNGLLTPAEIHQLYTNEKSKYAL